MMTQFEGVSPALAKALTARGYETLTPVQTAMLDPELTGQDLLVSAQTGSGKTVAFGIAAAPGLLNPEGQFDRAETPLALIITPTRELALQVRRELEWLYAGTGAKFASCVGGMDMRDERRALSQGAHIVVGTPGRLVDHISRGSLDMSALSVAILDEADEMLDLGFRDDLGEILEAAPDNRRTLLFSATVSKSIANLAKTYQNNAVRVNTVTAQSQHSDIEYRAITVAHGDKENALINVLRYFDAKNALVFCSTRAAVNRITSRMSNRGFAVVALSGEFSQKERSHALQSLRDGRAKVCIATDVAARGIDLPDLELVIHADLPKNREGLLHRSGRTGRAGRKGVSALIVGPSDRRRTERLLQNAKIEADWVKPPSAEEVRARDDERLLDHESFAEPVKENEQALVTALLERHGAEKVAAAILRLKRAEQSSPEELRDVADRAPRRERDDRPDRGRDRDRGERRERPERAPRERKPRADDFSGGVWFSLSVGANQTAEARWLLPMLCKSGGLDKSDIGAIRVHPNVTFVEIAPASVQSFEKEVGPDKRLEKSISVTKLDGKPDVLDDDDAGSDGPRPSRPRQRDRKPDYDDKRGPRKGPPRSGPKKPYEKKSYDKDQGKPDRGPRPDRPDRAPRETPVGERLEDFRDNNRDGAPAYKKGKKPFNKSGKPAPHKPGKPSAHKTKGKPRMNPAKPGGASRLKSKLKRKAAIKRGDPT